MPTIQVNLKDVEAFESLPVGKYLADIDSASLNEAADETKHDSLKVTYIVVDGDFLGRKQSEWLSFSPKAAFRMKAFFDRFNLGDLEDIDFDDESLALTSPDIVGVRVIFEVKADAKAPGGFRTNLISVEDDDVAPQAPAAEPAPARAARQPVAAGATPKRTLR